MDIIPQIIGLAAVATFLLSYQQKKRKNIIMLNVISRILYICQYLMLGAFSGAVLDIIGAFTSAIAEKKDSPLIKKHLFTVIFSVNAVTVIAGLIIAFVNQNLFDILPLIGLLFHTGAFWLSREKQILTVSLIGSPFWFSYNLLNRAYGSAIGDILTVFSIITAMLKIKKSNRTGVIK